MKSIPRVVLGSLLALGVTVFGFLWIKFPYVFAPEKKEVDFASVHTTWRVKSPAEMNMNLTKLRAFRKAVGSKSHGCIIKDGYLVYSWGDSNFHGDWGSATKPLYSTLLFFAVQEGRLESVDALVQDFFGDLSPGDRAMTFRHLANMTSGYSLREDPGSCWAYNDYGMKLYILTLLKNVYGVSPKNLWAVERMVLAPNRLGPLGFEDGSPFIIKNGVPRLIMTPRDYARVGWFWLNRGKWKGRQILAESFFQKYVRVSVPKEMRRTKDRRVNDYLNIGTAGGGNNSTLLGPGFYGFNWWFNTNQEFLPDVPGDAFQANGHWNREAVTVIPSLGLVVAWLRGGAVVGSADSFNKSMNTTLKLLLESVTSDISNSQF